MVHVFMIRSYHKNVHFGMVHLAGRMNEPHHSAQADREHRAMSGLSMGNGQSMDIGLQNLDACAWIDAFSATPS